MQEFDLDTYRINIWKLTECENIEDDIISYKKIIDVGMKILWDHNRNSNLNEVENDAHILVQMSLLKSISLLKLSEGLHYTNELNDTHLNDIFDSFGMGNIVRSLYEAFCNFNNIYIQSKNKDEIDLKYNVWVLSGLNSRQRFPAKTENSIQQREKEAKIILEYNELLEVNSCYNSLQESGKSNIERCIKKREWQIKIDSNNAYKIAWHEMFTNAGVKHYDEQYNYLSSVSHPSNLSVIQFKQMYEGESIDKRGDYHSMKLMLSTSKTIIAFLIRDYIKYFNLIEEYFEKIPLLDQMLINVYNRNFRGEDYVLNDCLNKLN